MKKTLLSKSAVALLVASQVVGTVPVFAEESAPATETVAPTTAENTDAKAETKEEAKAEETKAEETKEEAKSEEKAEETKEEAKSEEKAEDKKEEAKSEEKAEDKKEDAKPMVKAEIRVLAVQGAETAVPGVEFTVETEDGKVLATGRTDKEGMLRLNAPVGKTYVIKPVKADDFVDGTAKKITVPAEYDAVKSVVVFVFKGAIDKDAKVEDKGAVMEVEDEKKEESKVDDKKEDAKVPTAEKSEVKKEEAKKAETKEAPATKDGKGQLPNTGESTGFAALAAAAVALIGSAVLVLKRRAKSE